MQLEPSRYFDDDDDDVTSEGRVREVVLRPMPAVARLVASAGQWLWKSVACQSLAQPRTSAPATPLLITDRPHSTRAIPPARESKRPRDEHLPSEHPPVPVPLPDSPALPVSLPSARDAKRGRDGAVEEWGARTTSQRVVYRPMPEHLDGPHSAVAAAREAEPVCVRRLTSTTQWPSGSPARLARG